MWMIDFDYTSNHVIHVFDYNNYNRDKLLSEAYSRNYEPFEVSMNDVNSDPNWFERGLDVNMSNWTQARFFGHAEDGSDDLNNYPETNKVTKYFAKLINYYSYFLLSNPKFFPSLIKICLQQNIPYGSPVNESTTAYTLGNSTPLYSYSRACRFKSFG